MPATAPTRPKIPIISAASQPALMPELTFETAVMVAKALSVGERVNDEPLGEGLLTDTRLMVVTTEGNRDAIEEGAADNIFWSAEDVVCLEVVSTTGAGAVDGDGVGITEEVGLSVWG
jgi:hypothetical protein